MDERPHATLFMLMSVDGKISSGDTDALDPDSDWKLVHGVREGLPQYYELEKQTDLCFFQTGRVFEKIGFNEKAPATVQLPVTGVIVDNKPHLKAKGIAYLSSWLKRVIIVTTVVSHPARGSFGNVTVLEYRDAVDFPDLFRRLRSEFGIERVTIQSGGTMNAVLLRAGLIDELSLVVAPMLIGGSDTPTLIDGESLHEVSELQKIKALELASCTVLKNSFLHLRYSVIQDTVVDERESLLGKGT